MKPNVIHFHAESWDGRMIGPMGHPALKDATPNVDRLARAGAMFENAYCSHPICCPSRANMWSGRYTHNCESWNNHKGLEADMWALLDTLPQTHTLKTLGKLDYRSGAHTLMNRITDWLLDAGINKPIFDEDSSQGFAVDDDDAVRCHADDWAKADQAVDFLEQQRKAQEDGAGKPFFLTISTGLVHAAFHTNRYWLDKIPAEAVDIPAADPTTHPCRLYQRMTKAWRYGEDPDTVRQVRRIYFAMCAEADAIMGLVYDAMHRLGLAENTYFVFTSDHGEMALEHGEWYKMSFYEGSVRVPMLMTGPGIVPGRRRPNLVSLIDLCPTFLDMAELKPIAPRDGESLLPLATGQTDVSRDSAYACYMGITLNTTGFMLRRGRWKYVVYVGYPSQLFDIESDPGELCDVAEREPKVVAALDTELHAIVDYEQTHHDVIDYNRNAFRQWRRQARRGLFRETSYGLRDSPSCDYMTIMENAFTGYDEADERKVDTWFRSEGRPR